MQIQLITGRLAQTFSELNQTIKEQIKRRQSEMIHYPKQDAQKKQEQIQLSNQAIQVKKAVQQNLQEPPQPQIKQKDHEHDRKPEKVQKPKPKKVLVGHRPRKIQNAFKYFLAEMKKKNPEEDPGQVTKIASKKWDIMSEEEKKQFLDLEEKQRQRYELELQHFYDMNPEEKDKDMSKRDKKELKRKQKEEEKDKQPTKIKKKPKKQTSPLATPKKQSKIESVAESNLPFREQVQQNEQQLNGEEGQSGKQAEQEVRDEVGEIEQFLDLQPDDGSDSLGADI